MKTPCMAVVLAISMVLWVGCGGGESGSTETTAAATTTVDHAKGAQRVTLTYDGQVGPANVGIPLADAKGFFDDVGLAVTAGRPAYPRRPTKYVSQETDDLGITQLPQLVLAKEKGAPIIAVGSLVPEPTASLMWLRKSGIRGVADLKGKTIALPGVPFQEVLLQAVLARAGLTLKDVKVEGVGYQLAPSLLDGSADAAFGGAWNIEGAALKVRGADPVIKRVEDLGVPEYDELVVIAREDFVAENPQLIRNFLRAATRGDMHAAEHPQEAAKVIVDHLESGEPTLKETEAELRSTGSLLSWSGYMDPSRASALVDWMYGEGMIRKKWAASELTTNDYLPRPP
jgi:putative hydroxymethylpyrimidine transport system substrate-binding protein